MKTTAIKPCSACLGSGKILPEVAPWDRFLPGACPVCAGNGYPDTTRLKTLCVGTIFQTANGVEHLIVSKNADGCTVATQTGKRAGSTEYWPHNPAVRIVRRADVAFFAPVPVAAVRSDADERGAL